MRYFIDTNVLISIIDDFDLTKDVKEIIGDASNQVYISSECVKEFILLARSGKISLKRGRNEIDVFDFIENELGITVKYFAKEHLKTFAKLPFVDGHNDPFDRLIIAQAITENIALISSDRQFPKYKKKGLDFIPNY